MRNAMKNTSYEKCATKTKHGVRFYTIVAEIQSLGPPWVGGAYAGGLDENAGEGRLIAEGLSAH